MTKGPELSNIAKNTPISSNEARGDQFSSSFRLMFYVGLLLIAFYAIASLGLTVWSLQAGADMKSAAKAMFMVRLVQISLGMMIGFFTVFLGVIVAWMGIESKFRLTGESGGSSLTMASASPGILLIVSGTIMLAICLLKPMGMTIRKSELNELLGIDEPASVTESETNDSRIPPEPPDDPPEPDASTTTTSAARDGS